MRTKIGQIQSYQNKIGDLLNLVNKRTPPKNHRDKSNSKYYDDISYKQHSQSKAFTPSKR